MADATQAGGTETRHVTLPDGDGELAIAVADRWRGWLGAYLLDALVSAAAGRGVSNLEADVLATNSPMLALARARDCVVLDRPDMAVIRVLIGTRPPSPTWPGNHDRPRVLVEGPGTTWHHEAARAAGLEVVICPGPAGRRAACPALRGVPCPLAAGADAIVIRPAPDLNQPLGELVAAHDHLHAGVPVCLEARTTDLPAGAAVVRAPVGDEATVVAFVQRLAREGR